VRSRSRFSLTGRPGSEGRRSRQEFASLRRFGPGWDGLSTPVGDASPGLVLGCRRPARIDRRPRILRRHHGLRDPRGRAHCTTHTTLSRLRLPPPPCTRRRCAAADPREPASRRWACDSGAPRPLFGRTTLPAS